MADSGAEIGIFDMNIDLAKKTAAEIAQAYGTKVEAFQCNVTAPRMLTVQFADFLNSFGDLDGVFNNAGICLHKEATEVTYDEWYKVVNVNLNGIFLVAARGWPLLHRSWQEGLDRQYSLHVRSHCQYSAAADFLQRFEGRSQPADKVPRG